MAVDTQIKGRTEIEQLITAFYATAMKDDLIGFIFTDVAKLDWDHHIPTICSFWESVLFGTRGYKGNPMLKHIELNKKIALTELHFDRWIHIWEETIDQRFTGEIADLAKQRATVMKNLMIYKIEQSKRSNFIQ